MLSREVVNQIVSKLSPSVDIEFALREYILKLPKGGKILEIGVGDGYMSNELHKLGYEVYAADISEFCLDELSSGIKKYKLDIEKEELPFEENFFDAVIIFAVLEHLQYPEDALKKLKKTLKKGGLIFASTPNINWFPFRLYFLLGRCPEDFHTGDHLQFWNLKRFRKIFEDSGFKTKKQFTSIGILNPFFFFIRSYRSKRIEIVGKYVFISAGIKSRILGYNQVIMAEKDE